MPALSGRVHPPQARWFPTAREGNPERDQAGCPNTVTVGLPMPDRERVPEICDGPDTRSGKGVMWELFPSGRRFRRGAQGVPRDVPT